MIKKNSLVTAAGVLANLQTSAPPVTGPEGEPGSLYATGLNTSGQLAVGDTVNKTQLTLVVGGITDWVRVDGGNSVYLALRADRTLWSWGNNANGGTGLGFADSTYTLTPTQIGTDSDWDQIAISNGFGYAIKTDGTLWSWGRNSDGQLGQGDSGTGTERLVPTQVGTDTDWSRVFLPQIGQTAMAQKTDGTLWGCGENNSGQLGIPIAGDVLTMTQLSVATDWQQVSLGQTHTLALKTNGTLWAVGDNTHGQLGQGTSGSGTGSASWLQIGSDTNWSKISAGSYHNIALKTNGSIWGCGQNNSGHLGINNITSPISTMTQESSLATDWIEIGGGGIHSGAKKADGTLWTTGFNLWGQLGLGDSGSGTNRSVFTQEVTMDIWEYVMIRGNATMAIR